MQGLRTATQTRGAHLVLAAVAAALFGLMSMHGWGSHTGAHSMGPVPQSTNVMMAADYGDPHALSTMAGDESVAQGTGIPTTDHQTQAPNDEGGSALGLCLAILTGLVLGFALLMASRGIRIFRNLRPTWPNQVLYARDRDPPDLLQLCVTRC